MPDIFLSYAEEDREIARKIAGLLEQIGWSVWWDRKIPIGKTWRAVLEEAIASMRCMVVLWSKSSIASRWVYEEAEEGYSLGKLLPVLIERVKPPLGMRGIQAADLADWDSSVEAPGFHQLLVDLETMLGKPMSLPPMPQVPAPPQKSRSATASIWSLRPALVGLCVLLAAPYLFLAIWTYEEQRSHDSNPAPATDAPRSEVPQSPSEVLNPPIDRKPEKVAPKVTPSGVRDSTTSTKLAKSQKKTRCEDILSRAQLGEPLSEEDQLFLQKECQK